MAGVSFEGKSEMVSRSMGASELLPSGGLRQITIAQIVA